MPAYHPFLSFGRYRGVGLRPEKGGGRNCFFVVPLTLGGPCGVVLSPEGGGPEG